MRGSDGKIIALLFCLSFWLPYTLLKKIDSMAYPKK